MQIKYDLEVLKQARIVASYPDAIKRDLFRFLHDEDVIFNDEYGRRIVSYLAPETRCEIKELMRELPRTRKYKHNNNTNYGKRNRKARY